MRPRATDNLIKNTFEKTVRDIDQINQQMKSRQRASGASGQLGYLVESDQDWDRTETLPTTAANTYNLCTLVLTFTSDEQQWPIIIPSTDIRFNGTGDSNRIQGQPDGGLRWNDGTTSNQVLMSSLDALAPDDLENPTALSWVVEFNYTGSITYYLKCRGQSSARGTWSIARVH